MTAAGVMTANAVWNITKTLSGIVVATTAALPAPSTNGRSHPVLGPFRNNRDLPPISASPLVNANE